MAGVERRNQRQEKLEFWSADCDFEAVCIVLHNFGLTQLTPKDMWLPFRINSRSDAALISGVFQLHQKRYFL